VPASSLDLVGRARGREADRAEEVDATRCPELDRAGPVVEVPAVAPEPRPGPAEGCLAACKAFRESDRGLSRRASGDSHPHRFAPRAAGGAGSQAVALGRRLPPDLQDRPSASERVVLDVVGVAESRTAAGGQDAGPGLGLGRDASATKLGSPITETFSPQSKPSRPTLHMSCAPASPTAKRQCDGSTRCPRPQSITRRQPTRRGRPRTLVREARDGQMPPNAGSGRTEPRRQLGCRRGTQPAISRRRRGQLTLLALSSGVRVLPPSKRKAQVVDLGLCCRWPLFVRLNAKGTKSDRGPRLVGFRPGG
jgi:hypothetical protein